MVRRWHRYGGLHAFHLPRFDRLRNRFAGPLSEETKKGKFEERWGIREPPLFCDLALGVEKRRLDGGARSSAIVAYYWATSVFITH